MNTRTRKFLNGTVGSVNLNPQIAAVLGVLYVLLYLAAILGTPMLLIAAGLLTVWERWKRRRITL